MNDTKGIGAGLPFCGLARRVLAMAYDALVVVALLMIATLVALPVTGTGVRAGLDPLFSLYLLAVWFAYFGWCWRHAGATLGMRAWRVRLVTRDGKPPGWSFCALRFAVAAAAGLALGLGFAWSLFEPKKRCWQDLATHSFLVVARRRSDRAA